MECRVEFDYMAQEPDELSIKKGEIIKNVITKMDGWYEGTLGGKIGVFPDNFVKIIEKPQPQTIEQPKPPSNKLNVSAEVVLRNNPNSQRRVKVLFSYAPEQDDELPLDVGDVLDFIEEVEEGWWRGKLKGREGIFPSNFVEEVHGEEPKSNGNLVDPKIEEMSKPKDTSRSNQPKGIPDVVPVPTSQNQSIVDDEPAPELPPKPVRELARCFYPYKASNEDELTLVEGDIITIISKNCEDEGWWRGEVRGKIGLFPDNFVRIITPGETQQPTIITGSQPKQVAQDRNINISSPSDSNIAKTKKDSIPGINTSVTDGCGISKINSDNNKDSSKVEQVKAKLGKSNSKEGSGPAIPPQGVPIAPKVGHVATSPISPGIAAFHNNLFSNQKPADAFARRDPPVGSSAKDEKASDESEEFNSVERTETLNHLTANRAKAPKRRPPSAIITRENDGSLVNGSSHSYESSMAESPPPHHSTPINLSVTSNGTPSFVTATDGSSLNHSGSFLSQSRDKETSPIPTQPSANHQTSGSGGITASKPKKQALPWMAELKQTQDKKRSSASGPSTTPPPPVTTNPLPKESTTATSTSSTTKAPPLPAKPSSLGSAEKVTNNLNHSAPTINSNTTYGLSNKNFPASKKSPSPAPPPSSTHTPVPNHTSEIQRGDGDSNSNKAYVPYEDYVALKTRVTSLENEVETLKRQLKMFLDRELRSHIV